MKIVVFCEGKSEQALRTGLRELVQERDRAAARIGIFTRTLDGPTVRKKLGRLVELCLSQEDVAGVVVLTDVYPDFKNAEEAKAQLRQLVGSQGTTNRFRAHAAQFDLEAWIIPWWDELVRELRVTASRPGAKPEEINGGKPPSMHIRELFKRAKRSYEKPLDAAKWLTADRLTRAAAYCPELKSFLNSLLELAGAGRLV